MIAAAAEPARLPRTLIIDFYDSYTLNLLTLFAPYPDELVRRQVVVVRFDAYSWSVLRTRSPFSPLAHGLTSSYASPRAGMSSWPTSYRTSRPSSSRRDQARRRRRPTLAGRLSSSGSVRFRSLASASACRASRPPSAPRSASPAESSMASVSPSLALAAASSLASTRRRASGSSTTASSSAERVRLLQRLSQTSRSC